TAVALLGQAGRALPASVGLDPVGPHRVAVPVREHHHLAPVLVLVLDDDYVVALVFLLPLGLALSLALVRRSGKGHEPGGHERGDQRSYRSYHGYLLRSILSGAGPSQGPLDAVAGGTAIQVVVAEAHRLHERVEAGGAHERPSPGLEVAAEGRGL